MARPATPLKLAIVASGRTQREIALEVGVDEPLMSRIAGGLLCDEQTQAAIAKAIGRTVAELFPEHAAQHAGPLETSDAARRKEAA